MTPIEAVRYCIAGTPAVLKRRAAPLGLLALVALIAVCVAVHLTDRADHLPDGSALSLIDLSTDPSMSMIGSMVERGDLWGASARVESSYRFDKTTGLAALRSFSVLVLRRGLSEYDLYERCYALSALAAAGDRDEIPRLVKFFRSTGKPALRMAVADGLGDVGDADAVKALAQLYDGTEPWNRRTVVNGAAGAHDPGAIKLLSRALGNADLATRLAALRGLGQLGNRRAIAVLKHFLAAAHDPFEKATGAYSLLRLGDSSAQQIAEAVLRSRVDDNARAIAAVALGRARDPRVTGLLRQASTDRNLDVRIAAAVALTHYGDPVGVEYLRAAIRDEDSVTRLHVGQLLDEVEFSNAREVLRAAVASPDPELSLLAIRAIGLSGSPGDIGFLVDLEDKAGDPMTRAEVAWALGRIGTADCVPPLIAMVAEFDHAVRYTAADALDRTATRLLRGGYPGGA